MESRVADKDQGRCKLAFFKADVREVPGQVQEVLQIITP